MYEQQQVQHYHFVEVLDVLPLRLDCAVLYVYLVAYLVVALDVLPQRQAGFEVYVLHYRVRSHYGRADVRRAESGAEL